MRWQLKQKIIISKLPSSHLSETLVSKYLSYHPFNGQSSHSFMCDYPSRLFPIYVHIILYSYSDDDSESPKKIHSDMSLAELNQTLRISLPRPKSGEFLKLFEGNSP